LIITDSLDKPDPGQYARQTCEPARTSRRQSAFIGALLLAVLLPTFISLGLWQWRKAEVKTTMQVELDTRSSGFPVAMPSAPADGESLRYRRVILRGNYDASRQVVGVVGVVDGVP